MNNDLLFFPSLKTMFIVPSFEEIMQQETIKASEEKIKRKQERKARENDPKHLFRKGVYELARILDEKKAHEDENESLANDINMSLNFYYDDSLTDEERETVKKEGLAKISEFKEHTRKIRELNDEYKNKSAEIARYNYLEKKVRFIFPDTYQTYQLRKLYRNTKTEERIFEVF